MCALIVVFGCCVLVVCLFVCLCDCSIGEAFVWLFVVGCFVCLSLGRLFVCLIVLLSVCLSDRSVHCVIVHVCDRLFIVVVG